MNGDVKHLGDIAAATSAAASVSVTLQNIQSIAATAASVAAVLWFAARLYDWIAAKGWFHKRGG